MTRTRGLLAALLLASTAALAGAPRRVVHEADLEALPYMMPSWQGRDAARFDEETEKVLGADAYLNRTYINTGGPVGLYIAYYAAQRPGVSVHSPLHCLPGTGWEPLDVRTLEFANGPDDTGRIRRLVVRKDRDRAVVLYWYAVHGRMIANEIVSKLWLLHDSIRYRRSDASLVRVVVPVTDSIDAAERRGMGFVRDVLPFVAHVGS
jgi:EpsI family protein